VTESTIAASEEKQIRTTEHCLRPLVIIGSVGVTISVLVIITSTSQRQDSATHLSLGNLEALP